MNLLRTATLLLLALLIPGGLVLLAPAFYRYVAELRDKRRARASVRLAAADADAGA